MSKRTIFLYSLVIFIVGFVIGNPNVIEHEHSLQDCEIQLADNTDKIADIIYNDELLRDYADCIYKGIDYGYELDNCNILYDEAVKFNNKLFEQEEIDFMIVTE